MGVVQNPQNGVTEKSVEETDKSETKQGSAGVEDNPQICVMEKSVGDQVTKKKKKTVLHLTQQMTLLWEHQAIVNLQN